MQNALSFPLSPLHPGFIGPKPIEEAPFETFYDLEKNGNLIIQRKRNGFGSFVTITGMMSNTRIYTRGIGNLSEKLPAIIDNLRSIKLPKDTMLAGELLVEINGSDNLGAFNSIAKSGAVTAIELQKKHPVQFAAYNIIARKGESVIKLPYQERLEMLDELFEKNECPAVHVVKPLPMTFDVAREAVIKNGWEGLVLYAKDAGSEFRLDGMKERPPRPFGCWKWKPYSEGDFVATGWIPSTSKKFMGQVKDLMIAQYDPVTSELVPWGKVGVGLKEKERKELACDSLYPLVVEVKFECRTKNKRLINATILRRRYDKTPEECFSPLSK